MDIYDDLKHPDSDIDYGRNWGNNLTNGDAGWLGENEIIIESTWEITADREVTPTLVESDKGTGITGGGKITGIYLTGGTPGVQYTLTNRIVTFDDVADVSRIEKKSGVINCQRK